MKAIKPQKHIPLPSNQEAEIAILGAVLLEGASVFERAKTWITDDNAFYQTRHKVIWDVMNTLYKENIPIDMVTVHTEIKRATDKYDEIDLSNLDGFYLTGLANGVPTTANVEFYAKDVWYKYIQRKAVRSAQKLYALSIGDSENVMDILHKHEKIIEELKDSAPNVKIETEDIIEDTIETLKTGSNLIPFGIEQMDNAAGGMTRSEVTVVGGRPGHGKTTLVINIVKRLLEQGFKVMLFNREMSNTEMMKKILVMEFQQFSYEKIRKAENIDKEIAEISLKKETLGEKYKNLIMHDDCKTLADAMKEIGREKPDVILDDYIQLIRTDNASNKDRRFEIEDIMLDYKWICKKINCSAILVSQLNREIERRLDPRPKLSDFAESGVIEQTAEAAFFVYYPYAVDDRDADPYEIEVICQKARYGSLGSYNLGFNGDKCSIYFDRTEAIKVMSQYT
jgi:replicative DNA helicase